MSDLFISTTTFGAACKSPLNKLEQAGISFILNPDKRKLLPEETTALAAGVKAIIAGIEDLTHLVQSSQNLECTIVAAVTNYRYPFYLRYYFSE